MADDGQEFLGLCEKLAEKGSVEHQLFLGRQYFKLAKRAAEATRDNAGDDNDDDKNDEDDNGGESETKEVSDAGKAVRWLLEAAKNGSVEASELLRSCLDEKIGISPKQETLVHEYFGTKTFHKHVKKKAAKKLFQQVKLTPEKPTVTKDELLDVIKTNVKLDASEEQMVKRLAKKIEKENVKTEEEFVSVIKKHMQTSSPLYVDTEQYEKTSIQEKMVKYPLKTAEVVGVQLLEGAAFRGTRWLRTFIPYHQIQVMIAFCFYSVISLDGLLFALPLLFFYGSFVAMLITSLQVLYGKQKIRSLKQWANILKHFDREVDANVEEDKKTKKIIAPILWTYILSFILTITAFSLSNSSYIACPECAVLSVCVVFGFVLSSLEYFDFTMVVSILLNFLISLPHIFNNFPSIPLLYHVVAIFTKPLFTLALIPGFVINVSIPAVAYVIIPFVFFRMARHKSGRGLHVVLIPHLFALSWWHACVMFFCYSRWLGLLRATAGYAIALVLFPVTSILIVGAAVVVLVKLFSWTTLLKGVTTIALIVVPVLLTMWYRSDKRMQNLQRKYKALLLFAIGGAFVISSLSVLQDESMLDRNALRLSWKSYDTFCGKRALQRANSAQLQMRCKHLEGTVVKWQATVADVEVSSIDNFVLNVLDVLPAMMSEQLKCVYGEPFKHCSNSSENHKFFRKWKKQKGYDDSLDDRDDDPDDRDDDPNDADDDDFVTKTNSSDTFQRDDPFCKYVNFYSSKCHVDNFNYYRFSIKVRVGNSDQTIELQAGNHFKELCLFLRPGSRLKFIGRLQSGLGTSSPTIRVYRMMCTNCRQTDVGPDSKRQRIFDDDRRVPLSKRLVQSFGFVFNFFLSPLVTFEVEKQV